MRSLKYNRAARLNLILTAAVLALTLCIAIPTAYARYEAKTESEMQMKAAGGNVYMSVSEWKYDEESSWHTVDIEIKNFDDNDNICSEDQLAALEVFSTLGIADPAKISLVLIADNTEYTAVPTPVEKNTMYHINYGDGWIFKFYNAAGEELSWTLLGGEASTKTFRLKMIGNAVEPAVLSLILSGNVI